MLCGAAFVLATPARSVSAGGPVPVADATWDQVADCESDGDWAADTGNGYYGGLQIWPPTWREAGGLRYATRPDLASRRQQITVAQEILNEQGWQAWSACARELGLLPARPPTGTGGGVARVRVRGRIRGMATSAEGCLPPGGVGAGCEAGAEAGDRAGDGTGVVAGGWWRGGGIRWRWMSWWWAASTSTR